ncbi:MAG: hypothetical protein ABL994_13830, partial [Verrucomicrobiales bacterium]
ETNRAIGALQNLVPGRNPEHLLKGVGPSGQIPKLSMGSRQVPRVSCNPGGRLLAKADNVKMDGIVSDTLAIAFRLQIDTGMVGQISRIVLMGPGGAKDLTTLRLSFTGTELNLKCERGKQQSGVNLPWIAGKEGIVMVNWDGKKRTHSLTVRQGDSPLRESPPAKTLAVGQQTLSEYELGFLNIPNDLAQQRPVHFGDIVIGRGMLAQPGRDALFSALMN